jgi:hypothetical protein
MEGLERIAYPLKYLKMGSTLAEIQGRNGMAATFLKSPRKRKCDCFFMGDSTLETEWEYVRIYSRNINAAEYH